MTTRWPILYDLPHLLRGEDAHLRSWVTRTSWQPIGACVGLIVLGAGAFGLALGSWRAPIQGLYSGLKLPLVLLITALGNGIINGMLAPLLGINLNLRESLLAILLSFALCAAMLGAMSPLMAFMVWNSPALGTEPGRAAHSLILLVNVACLAAAGVLSNFRLWQTLEALGGSRASAHRLLTAWLVMNLFLGSQISWLLRPFVGSPGLPVEFLRPDAFQGSFFEAIFWSSRYLFNH